MKVRLKQVHNIVLIHLSEFQFHEGPIKTERIFANDIKMSYVSIP